MEAAGLGERNTHCCPPSALPGQIRGKGFHGCLSGGAGEEKTDAFQS